MDKNEFDRLMREFYRKANKFDNSEVKDDYNSNFTDGSKKAEEVLTFLKDVRADLKDLAYISIGGADGSEVFHILDNTPIKRAVILEYDSTFCKIIRGKKNNTINYENLEVLEGDAWGHRTKCFEIINDWFKKGLIKGVVISAFSVLHELPYRSARDYNLLDFVSTIVGNIKEAYIYCKEPSKIVEWEGRIKLNIPDWFLPEELERFSKHLQNQFKDFDNQDFLRPINLQPDGVVMGAQLGGEVIRKILYFLKNKSADMLNYELGECHAALDPLKLGAAITMIFKKNNLKFESRVEKQKVSSETLNSLFRNNNIELMFWDSPNDREGWMPTGFVRLWGYYRPIKSKTDEEKPRKRILNPITEIYASDEVKRKLILYGSVSSLAIDDSIQLISLNLNGRSNADRLDVKCEIPDGLNIYAENMQPSTEELICSIDNFECEVKKYLRAQSGFKADSNIIAEWKLGMKLISPRSEFPLKKPAEITVRPLSYLSTDLFNRKIIQGRVATLGGAQHPTPILENLYEKCIGTLLSNTDSYNFLYPSQLFLELAIVTSDHKVLLVKKKAGKKSGVVANLGKAWTCGPEFGLTFNYLQDNNYVLLHEAVITSLEREFGVGSTKIDSWHIAGLCIQHAHLNTALYGYCKLRLSGEQLIKCFKENNSIQFEIESEYSTKYPELVELSEIETKMAEEQRYDGKSWHPTAKIRLYSVLNNYFQTII